VSNLETYFEHLYPTLTCQFFLWK